MDNSLPCVGRAVPEGDEKYIKLISYQKALGKQISRINTCSAGLRMMECGQDHLPSPAGSIGKEVWWLRKELPATVIQAYPPSMSISNNQPWLPVHITAPSV